MLQIFQNPVGLMTAKGLQQLEIVCKLHVHNGILTFFAAEILACLGFKTVNVQTLSYGVGIIAPSSAAVLQPKEKQQQKNCDEQDNKFANGHSKRTCVCSRTIH